jgi:cytochrome c oxidase subunit 2
MIKTLLLRIGSVAALMPVSGLVWAQARYNLREPQTEIARQMYDLHSIVLVICLVLFVGVFGMMFYSAVKHRRAAGHKAEQFHENVMVEIAWTIVPFLILVGMAWPAIKTVIAITDTSSPDLTINATGYQWKWGYDYLTADGRGISFYSSLATPRDQLEGEAAKGEHHPLGLLPRW